MSPREALGRRSALARAAGQPVALMSGVTGEGVPAILRTVMDKVHAARRVASDEAQVA
jgi:hypothetical protein